ncbi:MAG: hypothetical protein KIT31_05270 [Deltaproteobacteria bacterium]|nr:hypothetical protein [Deltaproteobacteria bacterium]
MSALAFDKQGKPFSFLRRTKKLLVRLFRNPSARGTCSQVMTADGQPLYVDPETDYNEFRRNVGHVPGLYRLDQCDEHGGELEDAPAAYVAIDLVRNASAGAADGGSSEVSPLVIMEHMAAIQADAMKAISSQFASVMAASAEVMRAPYRPAPPAPAPLALAPRNARRDEEDDAREDHEPRPILVASPWLPFLERMAPMFETAGSLGMIWLQQKFLPGTAISMPTMAGGMHSGMAMPEVAATPERSHVAAAPVATASSSPPSVDAGTAAEVIEDDNGYATTSASVRFGTAAALDGSATPSSVTTAPSPAVPLHQQYTHLLAIRARLHPEESAFAESVIGKMPPQDRARWIAALSAMSLEDATASIRTAIAQLRMQEP